MLFQRGLEKLKQYKARGCKNCIIPMAFDSTRNIAPRSKYFIYKWVPPAGDDASFIKKMEFFNSKKMFK